MQKKVAVPVDDTGLVVVPATWGDDEPVALEKLRLAGLAPGRRLEEPSRSIASGCVYGTIPAAGAVVERGTVIAYIVANAVPGIGKPGDVLSGPEGSHDGLTNEADLAAR